MRSKIWLCVLVLSLAGGTLLWAAPIYGPRMPAKHQVFAGLQSYAVLNRSLENDNGRIHSLQEFFLLSYGITDWLSLDLKGGAGNVRQRSGTSPDINYPTYLGGGYGVRLKLYDVDQTKMILGFQHISIHPYTVSVGASKHKVVLDDWQFSFLVSHDLRYFTPYVGTRWSRMDEIHWVDTIRNRKRSDLTRSVGLIVGTDIPLSPRMWFNIEGQFIDATAVAGSINFSF
jgi:hypothetical protein